MIAVENPDDRSKPLYFIVNAPPFGARGSVLGFARAAAGIRACACVLFKIPAVNYLDDYPLVVPGKIAEILETGFRGLLEILGWKLKDAKDQAFSEEFVALGVNFVLSDALRGASLVVSNTEKRRTTLKKRVKDILEEDSLHPAEAASLVGKLQFASAQAFGRCGASALWPLRRKAEGKLPGRRLSGTLESALRWWEWYLETARPRTIRLANPLPPLVLLTDGACEGEGRDVTAG